MTSHDPKLPIGTQYCQCSGCGEYFNSVYAFDLHRSGKDCERRGCKTPEELLSKGWSKNAKGYWITEEYKK